MVIIKKSTNNKCWRVCAEKDTLLQHWWRYKLVQPLWKMAWRFLRKLKIELPYDLASLQFSSVAQLCLTLCNPLDCIHPDKTIIQKDTCTPMFIAALFTIARTWKQCKCPSTDKWIKKMCYSGILPSHREEWNNDICSNMLGPGIITLSEVNQKRQIPYDITYMWNLKYDTSKPIYRTQTCTHRGQTGGCQGKSG